MIPASTPLSAACVGYDIPDLEAPRGRDKLGDAINDVLAACDELAEACADVKAAATLPGVLEAMNTVKDRHARALDLIKYFECETDALGTGV